MLTLLLSAHDGGTAWCHALAPGEARAGFEPVGPLGLARRLGRILGIPAEAATAPERLAAYTQRLDLHDDCSRSYSASRKQDPFGVARYLLTLRDGLRLAGWNGRALGGSARLEDLAELEQVGSPLPSGVPDLYRDREDVGISAPLLQFAEQVCVPSGAASARRGRAVSTHPESPWITTTSGIRMALRQHPPDSSCLEDGPENMARLDMVQMLPEASSNAWAARQDPRGRLEHLAKEVDVLVGMRVSGSLNAWVDSRPLAAFVHQHGSLAFTANRGGGTGS